MEGVVALGLGGLVLSGAALWHGMTGAKAYVERLKSAHLASPTVTKSGSFVYVTGATRGDTPHVKGDTTYVAYSEHVYEVSVVRYLQQFRDDDKTRATYETKRLLLSTNVHKCNKILLGSYWDITEFASGLSISPGGEVFEPIESGGSSRDISINVQSPGASASGGGALGETERRVTGRVTVTQGIKAGELYTIFGIAADRKLLPCHVHGRLVFKNQTAAQVIQSAEESLELWNWTWKAIGCVSGGAAIVGAVGAALRQ